MIESTPVKEAEDLDVIVRAIDEAQNLLRGHLQLNSADAATTVSSVHEVLSEPVVSEALERVRLRVLNNAMKQGLS
jgi:hypothetical protein